MDANDLTELQKQDTWEFDSDEQAPAPRKARAIVSVAFPHDDFERIGRYAEAHRLKISELIRLATLTYVSETPAAVSQVSLMSVGGAAQMRVYFQEMTAPTVAGSATIETTVMNA